MAIVLAVAAAGILWFERRILGISWPFLVLLRWAAITAATWMVLEPGRVERRDQTVTRRVAVVADRSQSMSVEDDPSAVEMRTWAAEPDGPLAEVERAVVGLHFAAAAVRTGWEEGLLSGDRGEAADRAEHALGRAADHLEKAERAVSGTSWDRVARVRSSVDDARGLLAELVNAGRNADDATAGEAESLADALLELLTDQVRRASAAAAALREDVTPAPTPRTRRELVGDWLDSLESETLNPLESKAKVDRIAFDSAPFPIVGEDWTSGLEESQSPDEAFASTDITGALRAAGSGATGSGVVPRADVNELAGIILVTEGRHNARTRSTPTAAAAGLGSVPVFAVAVGSPGRTRDVVIGRLNAPERVRKDDEADVEAVISAYDCAGETAVAELLRGDEVLGTTQLRFDTALADAPVRFRIPTEKTGIEEYQLRVTPLDGEVTERNNVAAFSIDVAAGKIRVLLADSQARWEFRYLQMLFARDEETQCDEFLLRPRRRMTGRMEELGRLPRNVEGWRTYDVVLLGDVPPAELPADSQESLVEFVRTGGRLVVTAGRTAMPGRYLDDSLFDLLPVSREPAEPPKEATLEVTPEGRLNAAMKIEATVGASLRAWTRVFESVPIYDASPWSIPRDSAHVLAMLDDGSPAEADNGFDGLFDPTDEELAARSSDGPAWLLWQRVGAGTVVYLSAPSTYRLRFRAGDTYHNRFWGQMLRWLMAADAAAGDERVRIRTDKSRYGEGEDAVIEVTLEDAAGGPVSGAELAVELTDDTGAARVLRAAEDGNLPGRYEATAAGLLPGVYTVRPAGETAEALLNGTESDDPVQVIINVETRTGVESALTAANIPLLREVTAASGGAMVSPLAVDEVFALLPLESETRTAERLVPLWATWPVLCLVLGCLATEWGVRRWKGLV